MEFISLLQGVVQRWYSAKLYIKRSEFWKTRISKRNFRQKFEIWDKSLLSSWIKFIGFRTTGPWLVSCNVYGCVEWSHERSLHNRLSCLLFPKILLSIGRSGRGLDGISHDLSFFVCLMRLFAACSDRHPDCAQWAGAGECKANPDWMLVNCQQSCGLCCKSTLSLELVFIKL